MGIFLFCKVRNSKYFIKIIMHTVYGKIQIAKIIKSYFAFKMFTFLYQLTFIRVCNGIINPTYKMYSLWCYDRIELSLQIRTTSFRLQIIFSFDFVFIRFDCVYSVVTNSLKSKSLLRDLRKDCI